MRIGFLLLTFLITSSAMAESYRRLVNFEWESIEGAQTYELEIHQTNKKDAKNFTFKVKEAAWNGRLPAGKYQMRLRTRDARGVPGDWGAASDFDVNLENVITKFPAANANIATKEEKEDDVTLEWQPVGGAESYAVEVRSDDGKFEKTFATEKTSQKLSIPVATRFTWKISAKTATGMTSDAVSVTNFAVLGAKIDKPKFENPESEFVREVKWSKPDHVEKFDYVISHYNKTTKKWENLKTVKDAENPTATIDSKWPGGNYKIAMRGKSTLRQNSEISQINFKVREGARTPAAEYTALVRKSIDRVTGWYGIASYLITQINYASTYVETATALSYNALGGTGRLGAGWFGDATPWGFLSILDLSGFSYDGKNLTYASLELSAVYRTNIGERGEIRSQMGLFYKELPGTVGDILNKTTSNEQIATVGPHLGVEYWYSMTPKLGLQTNAHLYQSMLTMHTPNGQAIDPSLSYQFGFLGSWRFTPRFTGLAGYAHREDKIKYKAGSPSATFQTVSGGANETTVTGDYLNFFAEYAF